MGILGWAWEGRQGAATALHGSTGMEEEDFSPPRPSFPEAEGLHACCRGFSKKQAAGGALLRHRGILAWCP